MTCDPVSVLWFAVGSDGGTMNGSNTTSYGSEGIRNGLNDSNATSTDLAIMDHKSSSQLCPAMNDYGDGNTGNPKILSAHKF